MNISLTPTFFRKKYTFISTVQLMEVDGDDDDSNNININNNKKFCKEPIHALSLGH
jgi:hypothetical protein